MEYARNPAFKGWRSFVLVEPPVMLYFFGQAVTGAVTQELLLYRSCQALLGIHNMDCAAFHVNNTVPDEGTSFHEAVQPHLSFILMFKSLIDGLIPAFLSFFLGPWSDKYGRKPILVAGYAGSATSFLLWAILSSMVLDPWFYLIASVPPALVGGYSSLILATYCYITDITSSRQRAWHLTWQQSVVPAGQFLGNFAGPAIYRAYGYAGVFGTASAGGALSMLYVLIFVPETVTASEEKKRACCGLFDISLIRKMIATCIRRQENTDRLVIWCCILSLSTIMLVGEGELGIAYMFTTARFGWGIEEFSLFQALVVLLTVVGALLGAKFIRSFIDSSMSNMLIAVFALSSLLLASIVKSFAIVPWHFYLCIVLAMFGGLSGPVLRAALSKSVPARDGGKVFSLATSMEAMIPLASGPLYTMIYAYYMPPIYPSPVFLLSAAFYGLVIVLAVTIARRLKSRERLNGDSPETQDVMEENIS